LSIHILGKPITLKPLLSSQTYFLLGLFFILFQNKQHPKGIGAIAVEAFLTHLALQERVAASTQNQAFSALLFLYREVLR
jgi:Phage integrase, N-terminal SAM-like domain